MTLTAPSALAPAPARSTGSVVRIEGGCRLHGNVTVHGAKNATLPLLAATLLTEDACVLDNVPDVRDVRIMLEVLGHLGAKVEWLGANCLMIQAAQIRSRTTPEDLAKQMRASFLVMGPLLARFGQASAPQPGGCAIGTRPVSVDVKGFAQLGAQVATVDDRFSASGSLTGANLVLDYPSHTGTENLIMATVLAEGITIIENASTEPEVLDLIACLRSMGARIAWNGPATLAVQGVPRLHGTAFRVMPDRLEAATYLVAAAISGGDITLERVVPGHMRAVTSKLREMGAEIDEFQDAMRLSASGPLTAVSVQTYRYPGFPTDIQQPFVALLTQADGESTVIDTVFDDRMRYLEELRKMGADAHVRGQVAVIRGPSRLKGATVRALDLRAGACLVLAALAADGTTIVTDAENIERGYTRFVDTLADLGACCSTERVASAD